MQKLETRVPEQIPTISVVMCVYNSEKYLAQAIESILDQTYTNFEFIIVNDAATDSSLEILEEYAHADDRIRLIQNTVNAGLGVSLQKGIAAARGEYIARMDADDISLPDRFEKQIEYLRNHPEIMVLGGQTREIKEKLALASSIPLPSDPELMRWNMLLGSGYIVIHGSVMIRRKGLLELGNYGNYPAAQDFELWTRMFNRDPLPIANLDATIYLYRQHGQTTTRSQNDLQENIAIQARLEKIQAFLGRPIPKEVVLAYRYPTYAYTNIQECIQTWINVYRKFMNEFKVEPEARHEIRKELFSRINKFSYFPPQKRNLKYRVSLWKVLRRTPFSLGVQIFFSKIVWVLKRL